jgi:hypothetical protein
LGVFEFVIVLVLISTVGKLVSNRQDDRTLAKGPAQGSSKEIEGLRGAVDDMSMRLQLLEEERDFYRNLLEAPKPSRGLSAPNPPDPASGPND